jgi:hypothetical protein
VKGFIARHPVGLWLSLSGLLVFCPFPYLDAENFGVAQTFAFGLLLASLAVAYLAVVRHERGWEAVRILSFVGSWVWGALFLTHLLLLDPQGSAVSGVIALGLATVVWLAVFQYFRREEIQHHFPYRARTTRSLRRS